jgi:uncharacterized damage-inducible protein DinB
VSLHAAAAENDSKANFSKHWQVAKEFTLAVAEAMPDDGYDFKPTPEEMSFGALMVHIGEENSASCGRATGTKPLALPGARDKKTAIQFLSDSFDKCAREIEAMPPGRWDQEVYKFQGQPVLAREALWYTFTHMAHHRGQAEVYLRLKGIKPPAWRF